MKTITFYSYKGGVGRSLALANIATRLSEFNKKVCLIDFDLEAPGLHYKFASSNLQFKIQKGIVDYIYEFAEKGNLPDSILDFAIPFNIHPNKNQIHLIPAGTLESKDYWKKLSSIDWYELLYENVNSVAFFLDLKEKIKREINPDFLLIDSRTGISEMSGISISLLADEVVLVAANNMENLEGVKKIISSVTNPTNAILERVPKIYFVLSRVPFTEKPLDRAKENYLIKKIQTLFEFSSEEEVNLIHSDRELEENEKVKIGYRKDDNSAQISKDYLNLFEKLTKNELSDAEVQKFREIKEAERIYTKAIDEDDTNKSLELVNQSINLNPDNIEYRFFKGQILFKLKLIDEAKSVFSEIMETDSTYINAYIGYGKILNEFYKTSEAIDFHLQMTTIFPNDFNAYFGLAIAHSNNNNLEQAIESYNKVIEIKPDASAAYNNRADCYRRKGLLNEALKDIYRALELSQDDPILYATLGEIHEQLGNINEFYIFLEIALKISAKDMEKSILEEGIYHNLYKDDRFIKLLNKYNITLPDTSIPNVHSTPQV